MAWVWIILALVYILSPYDFLPDFVPVTGWIDDLIVLFLMIRYIARFYKARQSGYQAPGNRHDQTQAEEKTRPESDDAPHGAPHTILGVPAHADPEQIHAAYRKLANQYHPDKVAHLGREFQELAEKRFKDIQQAYEQLK